MQVPTLVHDTPASSLSVVKVYFGGVGVGTTDQLVPFQCAASGVAMPFARELPTATQSLVLVHHTLRNIWYVTPDGFVTVDQLVPFQCSIDVWPTATQKDVLVHDTPYMPVPGWAIVDQLVPFQCSVDDWPTATQNDVLVHDTAFK
jgi:hypothetical protein